MNPTAIARHVRDDVRTAIGNGTLTLPPFIAVTVRADHRGVAPSVNVNFRPDGDTDGDYVNAWKYTTREDNTQVLSAEISAAATAIIQMIKNRSGGSCYGAINCRGTIVAILMPLQTR